MWCGGPAVASLGGTSIPPSPGRSRPFFWPGPSFNLERELIERRYTELRQEGRILSGVAIRYGEIGQGPLGQPERFEPLAFGDLSGADVILNYGHQRTAPLARSNGGGLILEDTERSLSIRAELPHTTEADNVLALIRGKILKGLSIEFRALQERMENEVRVVERANLSGLGVVDSGAYPSSTVEARRRGGRGGGGRRRRRSFSRSRIPYKKTLGCECHRGTCNKVRFNKGAFDEALSSDDDVLAITSDYSSAMASKNRGSLILRDSDEGLYIELGRVSGETPSGKNLSALSKSVPVRARPIFSQEKSEFIESEIDGETVATYSRVHLRAIIFKPVSDPGDWPEVEFFSTAQGQRRAAVQDEKERRRVWL